MSQDRQTTGEQSDSDLEIDFDSAWKDKFGDETQEYSHKSVNSVNEDGYDGNCNVDFENEEPDGKKQRIEVTQAGILRGSLNYS